MCLKCLRIAFPIELTTHEHTGLTLVPFLISKRNSRLCTDYGIQFRLHFVFAVFFLVDVFYSYIKHKHVENTITFTEEKYSGTVTAHNDELLNTWS